MAEDVTTSIDGTNMICVLWPLYQNYHVVHVQTKCAAVFWICTQRERLTIYWSTAVFVGLLVAWFYICIMSTNVACTETQ